MTFCLSNPSLWGEAEVIALPSNAICHKENSSNFAASPYPTRGVLGLGVGSGRGKGSGSKSFLSSETLADHPSQTLHSCFLFVRTNNKEARLQRLIRIHTVRLKLIAYFNKIDTKIKPGTHKKMNGHVYST